MKGYQQKLPVCNISSASICRDAGELPPESKKIRQLVLTRSEVVDKVPPLQGAITVLRGPQGSREAA